MSLIVKTTHQYFNLNENLNPIVKALIEQPDDITEESKINAITGKNYVKVHEQLSLLTTMAKNIVRFELEAFKENVAERLRVKYLFAAFEELMSDDLNFADTIAVNKDTYLVFMGASEQNLNKVLTEFQRLYREFTQYTNYIDNQFKIYIGHIHDIVILKCPEYVVRPVENFPNTRKTKLPNLVLTLSLQLHPTPRKKNSDSRKIANRR
jgi:hypothetical protein